jgi:mannitol-1-phosphate/altronate dehydrogenase
VHLGLGAFHRSHQAWYTEHAADAEPWGIAAFTGRSPGAAKLLQAQDGLYTLAERGPERDRFEVWVSSQLTPWTALQQPPPSCSRHEWHFRQGLE